MGSALGSALSMTSGTSWNDIVTKIKGVTIGERSVSQSPTVETWSANAGGFTFLTKVKVDATGVYNNGYSAGRTQGQNDVKNSPGSYSLYTKSQYDANYTSGYNAGVSAKTSKIWTGHINTTSGGSFTTGFQPHIILIQRDGDNFPIGVYCSYGISVNHLEGPSNSHYSNIFSTNSNGFSLGTLNAYTKDKYCYCAAVRIV